MRTRCFCVIWNRAVYQERRTVAIASKVIAGENERDGLVFPIMNLLGKGEGA